MSYMPVERKECKYCKKKTYKGKEICIACERDIGDAKREARRLSRLNGGTCLSCGGPKTSKIKTVCSRCHRVRWGNETDPDYYMFTHLDRDQCYEWVDGRARVGFVVDIEGLNKLIWVYESLGFSMSKYSEYKGSSQLQHMWRAVYSWYRMERFSREKAQHNI